MISPDHEPQINPSLLVDQPEFQEDRPLWIPAQVGFIALPFNYAKQDVDADVFSRIPELANKALDYQMSEAESYRGFWVAAAGYFEDRSGGSWAYETPNGNGGMSIKRGVGPRIGLMYAANYKHRYSDEEADDIIIPNIPKNCAEQSILMHAGHEGFERLHTLVVAATSNRRKIKAVTGEATHTLCPCDECVGVFNKNKMVDADTNIITIGAGTDVMQFQTNDELQKRHIARQAGLDAPQPRRQQYREQDWTQKKQRFEEQVLARGITLQKKDRDVRRKLASLIMERA